MKFIIYGGIGFIIACVIAVKYGPWFKKTSTTVTDDVDNVVTDVKGDVTNTPSATPAPSGS
jgi:hypothetical protein